MSVVGSRRPGQGKPSPRTGRGALHPALRLAWGPALHPSAVEQGSGAGAKGTTWKVLCPVEGGPLTSPSGRKPRRLRAEGQEGPSGTWRPAFHPCSRSSCPQVGLGRRIILNLATSLGATPNNAFPAQDTDTSRGHSLRRRGVSRRKKDFKEVGEVRNSTVWGSQTRMFRGQERVSSAFPDKAAAVVS